MEQPLYNIHAVSKLPYTLSHPLEQAHAAYSDEKYGRAMNHFLDFFEISASFCSYVFLRQLQQEAPSQPAIMPVLEQFVNKIDTKRPLSFGDWLNDLLTPLLAAATKHLPNDPLSASFAEHIYIRRRNVLLGSKTVPSIVQIRNEYRGHSTTLSEDIYHGIDDLLLPRVCSMIEALMPLTSCSYDIGKGRYKIGFPTTGRQIDLYPLVFCNDHDYRYVLHTLKDEQTCYVASNENAITHISYDMNEAVDKAFRQIVPSFDIAKDLNWAEIRKCMQTASATYLKRVYAEKKYNQELFVEREELTDTLKAFHNSGKTLFPLIGEAGQGKTTQLAYWTERFIDDDMPVLTLAASDFSFVSLDMSVKSMFGYSIRKDIRRLVDNIHRMADANGQDVYIFVDALNECLRYADSEETSAEGPLLLYQALCRLFISREYTRFKLLFTCRNFTWVNLVVPHTEAEAPFMFTAKDDMQVRGFSDKDAAKAYCIYQQLYQMRTPYEQLDARVALRLRDPLTLKITSGIFLGKDLSGHPEVYTSIALYSQLYDDIANSYAGNRQRRLLDLLGSTILDTYLCGEAKDSLLADDIRQALADTRSPLHELATLMYRKDGVSIAYAELLHKAERPVLKEVERQSKDGSQLYVQFIYERFLEYVVGRAFVSRHGTLQASHFHDALSHGAMDVVFLGAIRNALIMTSLRDGNFNVLIELARRWGDDFNIISLVNDTMNTMINENYEDELFGLIPQLINSSNDDAESVAEFNNIVHTIQNNAADSAVIERHKELSVLLAPVMRLKKLASVSLINGILLSDFYNENLYTHDALALLWKIITDEIYDVRNDACMYIYYLSKRAYTNGHIPLRENLTVKIVKQIYSNIKSGNLLYNVASKTARTRMFTLVETSTRLAVLMIIDSMLAGDAQVENESSKVSSKPQNLKTSEPHRSVASDMLDEMKGLFRYLTCNLYLVKAILPFLQVAMKRQVTFQTDYVNNAMEYQTFWEKETFGGIDYGGDRWEPEDITELMKFCCYNVERQELAQLGSNAPAERLAALQRDEEAWRKMQGKLLSAYKSGDSLSLFVVERIMIIMGVCDWENVAPVARNFFRDDFRKVRMFDYAQMSILYSLYQIAVKTKTTNRELLGIYAKEAVDWTRRLRGLFKGHRSEKANAAGKYKRNLMSWYSAVYCTYAGECGKLEGDERCVPAFYDLIDEAIGNNDRELLIHLIDNIMELVTDMGYYNLALDLLKYIMMRYDSNQKIELIDNVHVDRKGIYEYGIVKLIGNVLSTAKNYCPERVNSFIQRELSALPFPGISSYQDSILNYNPSGESLQDVLTHKFGNFLIFSLLNVRPVDIFSIEAMGAATKTRNSFAWFEQVVKILIKHLFQK